MHEDLPANPLDYEIEKEQISTESIDYAELQEGSLQLPSTSVLAKSQSVEGMSGVWGYVIIGLMVAAVVTIVVALTIKKRPM